MATIASLVVQIQANTADLQKNVERVNTSLSSVEKMAGTVGKALVGMVSVAAVGAAVNKYIDFASRIQDLSAKAGMGVEAFQRLSYAAKMNGGDMEQVATGAARMARTLAEGKSSAAGALGTLGLSLSSLQQMDPADAFMQIGDAIGRIPNPMQQAALATALFGKEGANYLPLFKGNLSATAAEAVRLGLVLSEDTIRAADNFGDSLDSLKIVGMSVISQVLTPMLPALTMVAQALGSLASEVVPAIVKAFEWLGGAVLRHIIGLVNNLSIVAGALAKFNAAIGNDAGAAVLRAFATELDANAIALGFVLRSFESASTGAKKLETAVRGAIKPIVEAGKAEAELAKANKIVTDAWDKMSDYTRELARHNLAVADSTKAIILPSRDFSNWLMQAPKVIKPVIDLSLDWSSALKEVGQTVSTVFSNINSTVGQIAQVVGNGLSIMADSSVKGVTRLAAALSTVTGLLAGLAGSTPGKYMTAATGAAAGAMTGLTVSAFTANPVVIGLATGIGALVGAISGWAIAAKKAREADEAATKQIGEYQEALIETYGSLQNISTIGQIVGVDLAAAWGDKSRAGLEHFKDLMDEFKAKMDTLQTALEDYGLSWLDLGDEFKRMTLENTAYGLLEQFELMTAAGVDATKATTAMGGAFSDLIVSAVKSGQKIPPALQPILNQLIEMGGLTDEAARALLGLAESTMPALSDITAAAERYGLELDGLGPKVQQLRIDDAAKQIVADWELLSLAGADAGVVMEGMKGKVQDLVTQAIALGLELPASMEPLITSMVDAGLLVDDTGAKLTDMSKLTFAEDLAKNFDLLIGKLDELIDKLTKGLAPAISGLPDANVDVGLHYNFDQESPYPSEVPGFASGTGGQFLNFGTGTPVMLHGWERVQTAREVGAGGNVTVKIPVSINGRQISELVYQDLLSEVRRQLGQL